MSIAEEYLGQLADELEHEASIHPGTPASGGLHYAAARIREELERLHADERFVWDGDDDYAPDIAGNVSEFT